MGGTTDARGGTRQRMVLSAVALLREGSASAVSIDAVLAHSGAPRGSVYHHFPGGRDEMIVEAVRFAGRSIADLLDGAPTDDPGAVVSAFTAFWRQVLFDTDHRAGCPVLALAIDSHGDDESAGVVREVFAWWHTVLSRRLRLSGVAGERADSFTTVAIAAAEGAVVLCRVQRCAQPLDHVEAALRALITRAE